MMKLGGRVALLLLLVWGVVGDIYMHNPRGSNNRLNEATDDVQDEERLFDSQNNAKGGYGYGPAMSYVEGSELTVEWTNQHACGQDGVTCNLVLQYMCTNTLTDGNNIVRDGTTTNEISANTVATKNADGTYTYGENENLAYYQACAARERNKGLFTADQLTANSGTAATTTRQNPDATRYGFECQEERDYYPYWAPAPWKDVVVMANDAATDCPFYQAESQNVDGKGSCQNPTLTNGAKVPNNPTGCAAAKGTWVAAAALTGVAPDCQQAPYTRDNHLGNSGAEGAEMANYTWIVPSLAEEPCIATNSCNCVMRIRYNVSTAESSGLQGTFIDSRNNSLLKEDPSVTAAGGTLTLAYDTAQTGRTFQDRSFMFHINPRPDNIPDTARIINLNVRGKRGNIVQVYPALEYNYVPDDLTISTDDYVHIQWTGSNTNPANNEGEGTDGTDRSNIVQTASPNSNFPVEATRTKETVDTALFDSSALAHKFAFLGQTNCPTQAQLLAKNNNNQDQVDQDVTNCAKLNAAPAYFNGGILQFNNTGTFYYINTRNNNFSNRTQRGKLVVTTPGGSTESNNNDGSASSSSKVSSGAIAGIAVGAAAGIGAIGGVGALMYSKRSRRTLTPNTA